MLRARKCRAAFSAQADTIPHAPKRAMQSDSMGSVVTRPCIVTGHVHLHPCRPTGGEPLESEIKIGTEPHLRGRDPVEAEVAEGTADDPMMVSPVPRDPRIAMVDVLVVETEPHRYDDEVHRRIAVCPVSGRTGLAVIASAYETERIGGSSLIRLFNSVKIRDRGHSDRTIRVSVDGSDFIVFMDGLATNRGAARKKRVLDLVFPIFLDKPGRDVIIDPVCDQIVANLILLKVRQRRRPCGGIKNPSHGRRRPHEQA